ncbi:hypothetical protein GGI23_001979 [Coemansia sp. RSA 2559]|nr:hypothetical protein GGI23_001979 [Coemansia sp. RSA 2559]KAJ2868632.1 hypothetical protein GGI22_000766 [Coemansia erecta]
MQVRETAAGIIKRLASKYNVVLIVKINNEEDKDRVLETLAMSGIVPHNSYPIGQSVVWVERAAASSDDDDLASDPPSSAVSSILEAPSSLGSPEAAILPRENVLFCQTDEGKQHLVRHLLTLKPPTAQAHTYAGYIDTSRDVASRLATVLRKPVVLVDSSTASGSAEELPKNIQTVGDITQSIFYQ